MPQDPFLYSRTVQENIALEGHLKERAELERAASQVQVLGEIEGLPQGWDSQLGEKGVNLSGGQKQRLTLARALTSPAQVLLFDDVRSAVDTATEEKIESQLRKRSQHQTLVIAAHRLSTVRHLSHVLVMNGGELEFFGPWEKASHCKTLQNMELLQNIEQQQNMDQSQSLDLPAKNRGKE